MASDDECYIWKLSTMIYILSSLVLMLGTFAEAIKAQIYCKNNVVECGGYEQNLHRLIALTCPFIWIVLGLLCVIISDFGRYKRRLYSTAVLFYVWMCGNSIFSLQASNALSENSVFQNVSNWAEYYSGLLMAGAGFVAFLAIGWCFIQAYKGFWIAMNYTVDMCCFNFGTRREQEVQV